MPDFYNLRARNLFDPTNMIGSQSDQSNPLPQLNSPIPSIQSDSSQVSPSNMPPMMNPSSTFTGSVDGSTNPSPDMISQRMKSLYNPDTTQEDKLNQLISNYPKEEKPSILRRIGAIMTGIGYGPEEERKMLDEPNISNVEKWKNLVAPTENAANLERYSNTNARIAAYQSASEELKQEAQTHKENNDNERAKTAEFRAQVYAMKANNPNYKFDFKGPTVIRTDNTGKVEDTGVPTGSMSMLDKLNLGEEHKQSDIASTGSQNRQTEDVKQTGRSDIAEKKGWSVVNVPDPNNPGQMKGIWINPDTQETKEIGMGPINKPSSTNPTRAAELPTQTKQRRLNNANQAIREHPEWASLIKIDPNTKDINVAKPSAAGVFSPGVDEKTIKSINDYIDNGPSANKSNTTPIQDKQAKAIKILTDAGKPVTPANIAHVIQQLP